MAVLRTLLYLIKKDKQVHNKNSRPQFVEPEHVLGSGVYLNVSASQAVWFFYHY